jgi:hypothetical protein
VSSTHSNPPQAVQTPRTPSERGNSLTAVKLIARVRAEFGVRLPLWVVFQCASVSELAAQLDGRLKESAAATS